MYETAYANDTAASNGVSEYGTQVMAQGDKTHSNKLGGFPDFCNDCTAVTEYGFNDFVSR